MISFPEEFFLEEERCGFTISAKMKKAWAIQLTVLDKIMEIAGKNGISLWADYGTLLGAVRHKGYVPWDDDIDICLMREDYMKLLYLLRDNLPESYRVRSFYTTESYVQPKGFVSNRAHIDIGKDPLEKELTKAFWDCPFVAGVDLYPLDYAPADNKLWESYRQIYIAVYDLAWNMDKYKESGEFDDLLLELESLLNIRIERNSDIRTSLWKLSDSVAALAVREESDYLLWYPDTTFRLNDMRRPLSAYSKTLYIDFEMLKIPVPAGYEDVLKTCYGADYMTPRNVQGAHEYPFYKEQERIIEARF